MKMRMTLTPVNHCSTLYAYRVEVDGEFIGVVGKVYASGRNAWRHYLPNTNSGSDHHTRVSAVNALLEIAGRGR